MAVLKVLVGLKDGHGDIDDIDHLGIGAYALWGIDGESISHWIAAYGTRHS